MARILVIDDERPVLTVVKMLLERDGHDVVAADDSREGLSLFQTREFDLVILDIFMPGMDGFEAMNFVLRWKPETPIVVMSGHGFHSKATAEPDFLGMAVELGAVTALRKPFTPCELSAAVVNSLAPRKPNGTKR